MSCGLWQPGQGFPGQGCGGHRKPLHWLRPGAWEARGKSDVAQAAPGRALLVQLWTRDPPSLHCALGPASSHPRSPAGTQLLLCLLLGPGEPSKIFGIRKRKHVSPRAGGSPVSLRWRLCVGGGGASLHTPTWGLNHP